MEAEASGAEIVALLLAELHYVQAEAAAARALARLEVGEAGTLELLATLHRERARELKGAAERAREASSARAGEPRTMAGKEEA